MENLALMFKKMGRILPSLKTFFFGELNKTKLDELDSMQKEDNVIGKFTNGENILLKIGRYGPYVELESSKKKKVHTQKHWCRKLN